MYDKKGEEPYRLGHAYLVSPKGELIAAGEGIDIEPRLAGGMGNHWLWAQTSTPRATGGFEEEVGYWKRKIHQLETEPDRAPAAGWERKCEKGTCRWWNGGEKKWAE